MGKWRLAGWVVNVFTVSLWLIGASLWIAGSATIAGSENAQLLGVDATYLPLAGAISASVATGVGLIATLSEKRRVRTLLDPRRIKIRRLQATIQPIEQFFVGRNCHENPQECARVLGLYMQDARDSGLFDAPEFVDERVAMRQDDNPLANFIHVASMMRHKRRVKWVDDWTVNLPQFQKWLLEAIRREIELEESAL